MMISSTFKKDRNTSRKINEKVKTGQKQKHRERAGK